MTDKYNYTKGTEFSAYAGARRGFDITPGTSDLPLSTRAIMVSETATVTGILSGDSAEHTTFELAPGVMHPFFFERITAVSAGSIKGYA